MSDYPINEGELIIDLLPIPRQGESWMMDQFKESQINALFSQYMQLSAVVKSLTSPKTPSTILLIYGATLRTLVENFESTVLNDCVVKAHYTQYLTPSQKEEDQKRFKPVRLSTDSSSLAGR